MGILKDSCRIYIKVSELKAISEFTDPLYSHESTREKTTIEYSAVKEGSCLKMSGRCDDMRLLRLTSKHNCKIMSWTCRTGPECTWPTWILIILKTPDSPWHSVPCPLWLCARVPSFTTKEDLKFMRLVESSAFTFCSFQRVWEKEQNRHFSQGHHCVWTTIFH